MRGSGGGVSHLAWGGRWPGRTRVSVREGGVGWLGWPKAEAQWRVAAVAKWEGKWSGPTGVEGEVSRGWVESGAGPKFKEKFFSNFN
jgi:hypothetical protein